MNVLSTTTYMRDRSDELGWGYSGSRLLDCSGNWGNYEGHVLLADEECDDPGAPNPVAVGEPFSRPFYSVDGFDECGYTHPNRRAGHARPFFVDRTLPYLHLMDLTETLNNLVQPSEPDEPFDIAEFLLTFDTDGQSPPDELTMSLARNIDPNGEFIYINNVVPPKVGDEDDSFSFTLVRTDDFICE